MPHADEHDSNRISLFEAWKMQGAYGWVFILLLVNIGLLITLPDTAWARALEMPFMAATLVLALRTSGAGTRIRLAGEVGAGMAVVVGVAIAVFGVARPTGNGITYAIMAALLFVTAPIMLRELLSRHTVTIRVLLGGLSVYLIIGLFFAFVFLSVAAFNEGVFFNQLTTTSPTDYVYFSYVTMLTIGYGDLTPATDVGRLLSVMDGLLGQVFLVTTVARLVSLYGATSTPSSSDR